MSRRRGRRGRRLATALVAGSLVIGLGCLMAVGSPPVVGVDALWVKAHAPEVRLMLGAGAAALLFSVAGLWVGIARGFLAAVWIVSILVGAVFFSDRVGVIYRVMVSYVR